MGDSADVLVIDDDDASRAALMAAVESHETYSAMCKVCSVQDAENFDTEGASFIVLAAGVEKDVFKGALALAKPVRVGAVLDSIERALKKRNSAANMREIALGPWMLDTIHNALKRSGDKGSAVRLTEKEKDILVLLHEHTGQSVSRDDMLQTVWGFVDGVETHTLETHIYRLRQKIEDDPAAPKILLTTEAGYILGGV